MSNNQHLMDMINDRFGSLISATTLSYDMVTVDLPPASLVEVCMALRDETPFKYEVLIDACGVDYLDYGIAAWRTEETSNSGFSRGYDRPAQTKNTAWKKPRFAVAYHLLSVSNNARLRLKVYVEGEPPLIPSIINVWPSANWYEREAFDLYGIVFDGHPDLRRILTDYGFIGHPFRKDFPLIGEVELCYDAAQQRCVYKPVSIQPRVLVPKVIRDDARYSKEESDV